MRHSLVFAVAFFIAGCGGGGGAPSAELSPLPGVFAIAQGATGVVVTLQGANLSAAGVVVVSGEGVDVVATELVSDTELRVTLRIADDAEFGARDLEYFRSAGAAAPDATLAGAVQVQAPAPALTALEDGVVAQSETAAALTLTGSHFRAGGTVNAGPGLTVFDLEVLADDVITFSVDVAADAPLGPRDIVYTQPAAGGGSSATLVAALQVDAPVPTVASAGPAVLHQGGEVELVVFGTDFRAGGRILVTGGDLVLGPTTVTSDTRATVLVTVPDDAAPGDRTISFRQPDVGGGAEAPLADAVAVHYPDPEVTSVSPAVIQQGETNVTLTVTGSGFRDDGDLAITGAGLTLAKLTVVSDTEATVEVTADRDAAVGLRDVEFTHAAIGGGATGKGTDAVDVHHPDPALTSVSPTVVKQAETGVTMTLTGDHFRAGGAVTAGAGVTVKQATRKSDTSFEVTLDVASGAAFGTRDVVYTQPAAGGAAAVTLSKAFSVEAPVPTITSVSPTSIVQGASKEVLTLKGTGFRAGSSVAISGAGLTLGMFTFVSATEVTVEVTVDSDAALATRDVTYTQPTAGGAASATSKDALAIDAPTPTVTAVAPATLMQGDANKTLTVTGTNFRSGGTVAISGAGLTVGKTTFSSTTEVTVEVDAVDAAAAVGTRDVEFTQPAAGGSAKGTGKDLLRIDYPDPTLTAIAAATVTQGDTAQKVTLTGTNFRTGGTVAAGSGITVKSATWISNTEYEATLDVASDATLGAHDVTYTHASAGGGAKATLKGGLQVDAPVPTVTSVAPATIVQGAENKELTVKGTGFRDGGALSLSGAGLTLGDTTFVSATEATVEVTVDDAAAIGARDVTYTQPAAGGSAAATLGNAVTIHYPDPTLTSVTPVAIPQGGAAVELTVTGTGFRTGAAFSVSGSGV
ncbi:MAG: IPT/TIG domain-containing protein, partial [Planctomycetota bacterium]|nr:IPT/TIG domain-containing protein [Planctomycetota bacterium]